jgi:hypothetical protein
MKDDRTDEILKGFEREPTFFKRMGILAAGLRARRGTREYKAGMIELQRLGAPAMAVALPLVAVGLLVACTTGTGDTEREITVSVLEAQKVDEQMLEKPEVTESDFEPTTEFSLDSVEMPLATETAPAGVPAPEGVISITSPMTLAVHCPVVKFSTLMGNARGANGRAKGRSIYGGSTASEEAVMRALRWLKKNQQADGSWRNQKIAMTGLAILTFLAHGEDTNPADSPEFAGTVERGLEFLLAAQRDDGRFNGMDGNEYSLPIATYAMCEAFAMTHNPNLKAAAVKSLALIVKGQHPTGGWTYKLDPSPDAKTGQYRDDTSYMGWCAQALKAAKLAGINVDGLAKAQKLAIRGFKRNAHPDGGFGYTAPAQGGLTSVGTLCLQLLGDASDNAVKKSVRLMGPWKPSMESKADIGTSLQYYCYYATQAKFHIGGSDWENWNKAMQPLYVGAQKIERGAIMDAAGMKCDIGWWENADSNTDRPVMDTCLASLQLMVYYRYLPTMKAEAVQADMEIAALDVTDTNDIAVVTGNL